MVQTGMLKVRDNVKELSKRARVMVELWKASEVCYEWDDCKDDYMDEDMGWLSQYVFSRMVEGESDQMQWEYKYEAMRRIRVGDKEIDFELIREALLEVMEQAEYVSAEHGAIVHDLYERVCERLNG